MPSKQELAASRDLALPSACPKTSLTNAAGFILMDTAKMKDKNVSLEKTGQGMILLVNSAAAVDADGAQDKKNAE